MTTSIIKDILFVLNDNMTLYNKRIAFIELRKKKRGHNRQLIDIVCDMIEPRVLPLQHSECLWIGGRDFTEKECCQLKSILLNSNCSYFNAVCGEVLWTKENDSEAAGKALRSYEEELLNPSITDKHIYTELTVGLCRLYSRYRDEKFDFETFLQKSICYVKANYETDGYELLFILNALLDCSKDTEQIENVFEDVISFYESKNILEKVVGFLEDLEIFYKKRKRPKELESVRVRIAETQEKIANKYDWENPEHARKIIFHVHSAMNAWDRADSKAYKSERQRLAKKIDPVKKLSLQAMKIILSGEIDLGEWMKTAEQVIESATLESFIYQLATIIPLESYEGAKQNFKKRGFFAELFPTAIVDNSGRKKCVVPAVLHATETDLYAILENETSRMYNILADFYVNRLLYLARDKFKFEKEELRFLVEDNLFIPSDHKESFLMGIVAGFNLDLITAMHLLMPQVECCIRCLAEECGAVVYKTDKSGVEECLSLSRVLELPEVKECFDDTFLFNLKLFFTSVYGFGMRNDVCHGLYSDSGLQSTSCLAVWWFALRICCSYSKKLNKRLAEQEKTILTRIESE